MMMRSASEMPRRVAVSLRGAMLRSDADVLSNELSLLGFARDAEHPEGAFVGDVEWSDSGPTNLNLELRSIRTGTVL